VAAVAARHLLAVPTHAIVHALSAQNPRRELVNASRNRGRLLGGREKHEVGSLASGGKRFKRFTGTTPLNYRRQHQDRERPAMAIPVVTIG
jgi:hypothetical protein